MAKATEQTATGYWADFPSIIPAMIVKELRVGLRTNMFVISMIVAPLIIAIPFLLFCIKESDGSSLIDVETVDGIFWILVAILFVFLQPIRGLGGISREVKSKAIEFLLLSPLSSSRIVVEKWLSLSLQSALLWCILLPFLVLRYFMGGAEIWNDLYIITLALTLSWLLTAVSLWISGMPVIMRILMIAGGVFSGFGLLIAIGTIFVLMRFQGDIFKMTGPGIFLGGTLPGADAFLMIPVLLVIGSFAFLFLAARSISSPAENLSLPFRKCLLGLGILPVIYCVITGLIDEEAYASMITVAYVGLNIFLPLFVIELVLSSRLLPEHVRRLEARKGRRAWIERKLRLFFLPGWQGTALIGLVVVLLISLASFLIFRDNVADYIVLFFIIALATWGSMIAPVILFRNLFIMTKYYALIIYAFVAGVLYTVSSILMLMNHGEKIAGLIPFGSIIALGKSEDGTPVFSSTVFNFITLVVFLCFLVPYSRKAYRRETQK